MTATEETKTVLLDCTNLAMRSFHAAKYIGLSGGGQSTGALVLFVNSLSRHLSEDRPTHFVACWDSGGSRYREQRFPGYKLARRQAVVLDGPAPHAESFRLIREFLQLAQISSWRQDGIEADDLIAAAHRRTPGPKLVLSSDKDLLQLLDGQSEQVRFTGDPLHLDRWDAARVEQVHGCSPQRLPLLMALTGDAADGIPGLPGIGPKRALKMLTAVDWEWDKLLVSLTEEHRDLAQMCLELVDLGCFDALVPSVPVWDPYPRHSNDHVRLSLQEPLEAFCARYELRNILSLIHARTLWW
jgi:DNA polymerase-1